jgi:hypothetical protein
LHLTAAWKKTKWKIVVEPFMFFSIQAYKGTSSWSYWHEKLRERKFIGGDETSNCFQCVLGNILLLHSVAYVNKYALSTVVHNDGGSLNNGREGKWFDTVGDQDCDGIHGSRPWVTSH